MKWLGILGATAIAVMLAYSWAYPSVDVRYRLTIEVEADGKVYVGSSVIEGRFSREPAWFTNYSDRGTSSARGEAVAVDIGSRGTLFALLTGGDGNSRTHAPEIIASTFPGQLPPQRSVRDHIAWLGRLAGTVELRSDQLPLLVRFRNITDPMSVQKVDPHNLATSFGVGVALRRATIEIVASGWWPGRSIGLSGVPITEGIERRLTWLARLRGNYIHGGQTARGAPLGLTGEAFKRGPQKS